MSYKRIVKKMRDSESRSSYRRSKLSSSRSASNDRDQHRTKDRERDKNREKGRDRDRDRNRDISRRDGDRNHYTRSKSPIRSHSKLKKSKSHNKGSRNSRSRSTSSSTTSSQASHSKSSSHSKNLRAPSSESNSRASVTVTPSVSGAAAGAAPKNIDVNDFEVKKTLEAIEEDVFVAKPFFSTCDRERNPALEKVIINLNTETVTVQVPKPVEPNIVQLDKEDIFHPNFIQDAHIKAEKWIRKLFSYRQRYRIE